MMARRTAGRLGDGGGPGTWRGIFPRPRRALPGEAQVLQVREGHAGHQGVPVQAGPGPALEVAETEFLLQLLVCQRALIAAASARSEVRGGRLLR